MFWIPNNINLIIINDNDKFGDVWSQIRENNENRLQMNMMNGDDKKMTRDWKKKTFLR